MLGLRILGEERDEERRSILRSRGCERNPAKIRFAGQIFSIIDRTGRLSMMIAPEFAP